MTDVTDVLRDRLREPAGLQRMTTVSLVVHGALIALLFLWPRGWWAKESQSPQPVMTITLGGGSAGPSAGGMTPMGGRPVQVQTPPDEPKRPEAVRPPAARAPEMTLPRPNARPTKATPAPPVKQAPEEARGRTPTRGAEVGAGSAVAETGVRGQGFGLSSGGGAGSGLTLDVANFCCPDYLMAMIDRIRASWNQHAEVAGSTTIRFTILRDGEIKDVALEKSSGYIALDINAQRAIQITRTLPPLPAPFPNPTLTVHLDFQYQR